MVKSFYPYFLGFLIGMLMLPLFFLGFNLSWGSAPWLGALMMYSGLFLWPAYVLLVVLLSSTYLKHSTTRKKQFYHSLYLPFFGGIFSLVLITLFYQLFIR